MALNPEEMRRRREERAHQKMMRKRQQKKLLIRLSAAVLVLLFSGVVIYFTSQKPAGSQDPGAADISETGETVPETEETVLETETAVSSSDPSESTVETAPATTIHLALGGDLNVTNRVIGAEGEENGFAGAFMDVSSLLADADLSVLNFEGNLIGAPYGNESKSAPQAMMDVLSRNGVDMIQLANSYSIYNGTSGLVSTINGVRSSNMEPLGVYTDQQDFDVHKGYTIRDVQGIKIAFVAFTKGMDGMALPEGSEHCVNLLYTDYDSTYQKVDTENITAILKNVEKEKPDVVIALLHWGSEFNDTISTSQKEIVSLMQKNGVDAIIGSHSHYVQQITFDRANGSLVAYSLGDFFGDGARAGSEYSIILDLEITRDNQTGSVKITGYSYTPIYTVNQSDMPLQVVRIKEAMTAYEHSYIDRVSKSTYENMKYALERIDIRIKGE